MSKPSVLIVEDEKVLQDAYKLILTTSGFTVYTADNGAEALQLLKQSKPSVMLLDLFMPIMDGLQVLRKLNRHDYPDTKIIVYSNLSNSTVKKDVLAHGADKYVLKSNLSPNDLIALVKSVL